MRKEKGTTGEPSLIFLLVVVIVVVVLLFVLGPDTSEENDDKTPAKTEVNVVLSPTPEPTLVPTSTLFPDETSSESIVE